MKGSPSLGRMKHQDLMLDSQFLHQGPGMPHSQLGRISSPIFPGQSQQQAIPTNKNQKIEVRIQNYSLYLSFFSPTSTPSHARLRVSAHKLISSKTI